MEPILIPFGKCPYRPILGIGVEEGRIKPVMTQAYTQIMVEMNVFLTI